MGCRARLRADCSRQLIAREEEVEHSLAGQALTREVGRSRIPDTKRDGPEEQVSGAVPCGASDQCRTCRLPSRPCVSSFGPAVNSTSSVPPSTPLPGMSAHSPSMVTGS
jgi:hypothetical protein